MAYTPKSKRETPEPPIVKRTQAIMDMISCLRLSAQEDWIKLFEGALYATAQSLKGVSEKRAYIQDFAAALNRRGLLKNEDVDHFTELGYQIIEGMK